MEGNRMIASGVLDPHEPLPDQDDIPLVGSSIALFREHDHISSGRGTLGGYIEVDGEIFGLTNQHVCLGPFRVEAYPSGEESKLNSRLYVSQPAEQDLEDAILDLTKMLAASREQKASHHRIAYEQSRLDEMKVWAAKDKKIGYVYQTSGLRVLEGNVGERFKMDWAIIKLDNTKRFPDPSQIINRVSTEKQLNWKQMLMSTGTPLLSSAYRSKIIPWPCLRAWWQRIESGNNAKSLEKSPVV
jgi:hypothetical protein